MAKSKLFNTASLIPELSYTLTMRMPQAIREQPNSVFHECDDDYIVDHYTQFYTMKPLVITSTIETDQVLWKKCQDEAYTRERAQALIAFEGTSQLWGMRVEGDSTRRPTGEFHDRGTRVLTATAEEGNLAKALKKLEKLSAAVLACAKAQEKPLGEYNAALGERVRNVVVAERARRGVKPSPLQFAAE